MIYRPEIARLMKEKCPEIKFTDFEVYLDNYIKRMKNISPATVKADLKAFKSYYFDHNEDPARLSKIEQYIKSAPKQKH